MKIGSCCAEHVLPIITLTPTCAVDIRASYWNCWMNERCQFNELFELHVEMIEIYFHQRYKFLLKKSNDCVTRSCNEKFLNAFINSILSCNAMIVWPTRSGNETGCLPWSASPLFSNVWKAFWWNYDHHKKVTISWTSMGKHYWFIESENIAPAWK